jgi:hypothetical protein
MGRLTVAANNADIGGGEVMAIAVAEGARDLGAEVEVVGPHTPGGVLDRAEQAGFAVVALPPDRRAYARALRAWDRRRKGILWCAGLVPSLATAGHRRRVVHLHQRPHGAQRGALTLARHAALATLVPSYDLAAHVRGATTLWNWTDPVQQPPRATPVPEGGPVVLGFLGRPSPEKGVLVLAEALARLDRAAPGAHTLLLAGEPRFVAEADRRRVEAALAPVRHLVTEVGWVDRADFLARVDLAVFPSLVDEAFGLVVAEAMAARVPFVVSEAGALPEVAGPDHPYVVPRGDASALVDTVTRWQSADEASTRHTLDAAHERWRRHFSPEAGRDRLAAVLTALGVVPGGSDG